MDIQSDNGKKSPIIMCNVKPYPSAFTTEPTTLKVFTPHRSGCPDKSFGGFSCKKGGYTFSVPMQKEGNAFPVVWLWPVLSFY